MNFCKRINSWNYHQVQDIQHYRHSECVRVSVCVCVCVRVIYQMEMKYIFLIPAVLSCRHISALSS